MSSESAAVWARGLTECFAKEQFREKNRWANDACLGFEAPLTCEEIPFLHSVLNDAKQTGCLGGKRIAFSRYRTFPWAGKKELSHASSFCKVFKLKGKFGQHMYFIQVLWKVLEKKGSRKTLVFTEGTLHTTWQTLALPHSRTEFKKNTFGILSNHL